MADVITEQVRRLAQRRKRSPEDDEVRPAGKRRLMRRQDGTGPHGIGAGPGRGVRAMCGASTESAHTQVGRLTESRGDRAFDAAVWLLDNPDATASEIQREFDLNMLKAALVKNFRDEAFAKPSQQALRWLSGMLRNIVESVTEASVKD